MANIGDKIYEVDNQSFTNLANTVNDSSTGLVTRVDQLETNPIYTTAEAYNTGFNYPAGYPIIRNGRLEYSNKATSGAYVANDWDAVTRANGDPVVIESGTDSVTIKMVGGVPTLEVTDGTSTKSIELKIDSGRVNMPNAGAVADAGDNEALAKKDVAATSDRFSWDDTEKRITQANEPTATASDSKDLLTLKDGSALYIEKNVTGNAANTIEAAVTDTSFTILASTNGTTGGVSYSPIAKRLIQDEPPVATAADDAQLLTKKDGDELYQPIGTALEGITLPNRGVHILSPAVDEDTLLFTFDTLAPLDNGVPTTVSVYASTANNQVNFYLSSRVPYYAKFQGTRAVTTRANGEVAGADGTVVYASARRWVSGTAGHTTAQTLTTANFDREDCVSLVMQFGRGGGNEHNFACSCQIELSPIDSSAMNLLVTPLSGKQQS